MFTALVVQRHAAHLHLYKTVSPPLHRINELSLRAFRGRPAAAPPATVLLARRRLYATIPSVSPAPGTKPSTDDVLLPPDGKKKPKGKVELRPSPKLPETPVHVAPPPPVSPPSPAVATTAAQTPSTSSSASKSTAPSDVSTQPLSTSLSDSTPSSTITTTASSSVPPAEVTPTPNLGLRSAIDLAIADVQRASRDGQIVAPDPSLPWVKRMWIWGIEVAKFYWRGLKRFRDHRRIVGEIDARVREEGRERTWREEKFVRLYRSDRIKLVPFIIILIVLEEAIPVIVIWAPFLLPSTCIMSSQRERMEANRLTKQRAALAQLGQVLNRERALQPQSKSYGGAGAGAVSATSVAQLRPEMLKALCGTLSLSTFLPTPFLRTRLARRLSQLTADDTLLQPALPGLDEHELRQAVDERGGVSMGVPEEEMRAWLKAWLNGVSGKGTEMVDGSGRRLTIVLEDAWRRWESRA